jgi:hypothetical protein
MTIPFLMPSPIKQARRKGQGRGNTLVAGLKKALLA